MEESPAAKKQIYVTRSLAVKTDNLLQLQQHISAYATAAAEKLRRQNHLATELMVFANSSRFAARQASGSRRVQLPYPTNDSRLLIRNAKQAIRDIHKPGFAYAQCGVGIVAMEDVRFSQQELFGVHQPERDHALMEWLDAVNQKYGQDSLVLAAQGFKGKWRMNRHFLSPGYLNRWTELPKVVC